MNGIIACLVASKPTGIFSVIKIYVEKSDGSPSFPRWEKLYGQLFDKCVLAGECQYGDGGHWSNGGGQLAVVGDIAGFAVPFAPQSPVFLPDYLEPLTIAKLSDVPPDFLDSVTFQTIIRGKGKLVLTQETLEWAMWRIVA